VGRFANSEGERGEVENAIPDIRKLHVRPAITYARFAAMISPR
jgi:hypothetical protein